MVVERSADQAERGALPIPWGARELWGGFGLAVFLYFLFSILVIVGITVLELDWQNSPKFALLIPITQVVMALPPLVIMARYGNIIRMFGLNRFHWSMLLETGAAILFGFTGTILWGLLLFATTGEQPQEPILQEFGEGIEAVLSLFVVAGVIAPVVEEILFRGFLFAGLTRFTEPFVAALISGVLFGAMHLQLLAFPALFMLGVVLALLYYRTGSLWMPILMHVVINSVAILAQYAAASQGA